MTTLVSSIKNTFTKDQYFATSGATAPTGRVTKLTKPVMVLTRSRGMSLETFMKQLQTWTEINQEIPEFMKFHDFMESLKVNKDIKDLPRYVGEHVLPVLEKRQDQRIKKALELL